MQLQGEITSLISIPLWASNILWKRPGLDTVTGGDESFPVESGRCEIRGNHQLKTVVNIPLFIQL